MKKIFSIALLMIFILTGCSNVPVETPNSTEESTVVESTVESSVEESSVEESTEEVHEHSYTEIVVEATCENVGMKTYSCECGDSYEEEIPAQGHSFVEYVYNEDATYTTDGTKTATCVCGKEDVIVAEGTKLEYTFEDLNKTMYCVERSNLRDMPSDDGNQVTKLSTGSAVKVTGICKETKYYRVEHEGKILYTTNSNLSDTKPVEKTPTVSQNTNTNTNTGSNSNNGNGSGSNTSSGNTNTETPAPTPTPTPEVACSHPGGHQVQRTDPSKSYTIDLSTGATITDTTGKCYQYKTYYITYCDLCGTVLRESLTDGGGQHYSNLLPRISPTCTTDGRAGGNSCPCGWCNEEPTVIPATGHNFVTEMTGNMNLEEGTTEYTRYCVACGLSEGTWWE